MPNRGHEPVRTCIACREEAAKPALIRVVRGAAGLATIDPTGRAPGRGAYVHHRSECVETARKRRQLERALGAATSADFWSSLALLV